MLAPAAQPASRAIRLDEDHSREPRRCRTRGQTPATPASQTRTAPVLLDFSATATTDQGHVRSLDHPHLDADRRKLAGLRNQLGNWGLPPEDGRPRLMKIIDRTIDSYVILR